MAIISLLWVLHAVEALPDSSLLAPTLNMHLPRASREIPCGAGERDLAKILANSNKAPVIVGRRPDQAVEVSPDFDWDRNKQVLQSIEALTADVEGNWERLVKEFDNTSYCITFRHDMSVRNYTVGQICQLIVAESLSGAYRRHLPSRITYNRLRTPEVARGKEFAAWCSEQKRNGRKLWELQIMMCDDAIRALRSSDFPDSTRKDCEQSIQRIKATKRRIEESKTAIPLNTIIIPDLRVPITQEDVVRRQ